MNCTFIPSVFYHFFAQIRKYGASGEKCGKLLITISVIAESQQTGGPDYFLVLCKMTPNTFPHTNTHPYPNEDTHKLSLLVFMFEEKAENTKQDENQPKETLKQSPQ